MIRVGGLWNCHSTKVAVAISRPAIPEMLRVMRTLGGRSELVLRRVQIRVAGAPDYDATAARIRTDGGLELTMPGTDDGLAAVPARVQCFWLIDLQAGQLT